VYDLLNCGPRYRFVVLGDTPMIVSNCQSTGHDLHLYYIGIVQQLLKQEGIPWEPVIVDFHDQMIVEVDPKDADRVQYLMGVKAYEILNARVNGLIRIKGEANIVQNLAYAKVENWGSSPNKN